MTHAAQDIIAWCCRRYGSTYVDFVGRGRMASEVRAREAATYLMRRCTLLDFSYPEIKRECCSPNHSTAITRMQRFQARLAANDPDALEVKAHADATAHEEMTEAVRERAARHKDLPPPGNPAPGLRDRYMPHVCRVYCVSPDQVYAGEPPRGKAARQALCWLVASHPTEHAGRWAKAGVKHEDIGAAVGLGREAVRYNVNRLEVEIDAVPRERLTGSGSV